MTTHRHWFTFLSFALSFYVINAQRIGDNRGPALPPVFNNGFDNQFPSQFGPSSLPRDKPFGPRPLNPIDQNSFLQPRPAPSFNDLPIINAPGGPLGPAGSQPFGSLPYDNSPFSYSYGSQFGPSQLFNQNPFIDELPPVNSIGPQPGALPLGFQNPFNDNLPPIPYGPQLGPKPLYPPFNQQPYSDELPPVNTFGLQFSSLPPVLQNPFNGDLPPINYGPPLGPKPQYPPFINDLPSINQFGPGAPPVPPFIPNYNDYSPYDSFGPLGRASGVSLPLAPVIPQNSLFPVSYSSPLGSPGPDPFIQPNAFGPIGYPSAGYLPPVETPSLEYGPESYLPPGDYQSLDYLGSSGYSPYYNNYSPYYNNYGNNDDGDILRELLPWLLILRNRAC